MTYRLTLASGKEEFFGYAGELLQYAEREWPARTCKFAPVLLIATGEDRWQLQGIDMRVLGEVELTEANGHVPTSETPTASCPRQYNYPNGEAQERWAEYVRKQTRALRSLT